MAPLNAYLITWYTTDRVIYFTNASSL